MGEPKPFASSFRDPSGYVYSEGGEIYRHVNQRYQPHYDLAVESGLFDELHKAELLVSHSEVSDPRGREDAYKTLRAETIPLISYPYEWSFSQYRDAALYTLEIQRRALAKGMVLKDASAYNIQFLRGKPIFIDTLSFETYNEGEPWVAYGQFARHFLAPLALMAKSDINLSKLIRLYIDGIPLDLAVKTLPMRSRFRFGLMTHLYLHARAQQKHAASDGKARQRTLSKRALEGLTTSLANTIKKLRWKEAETEWGDYYSFTNYDETSFDHKRELVSAYIDTVKPSQVWDLGANNGHFSRIASDQGIPTAAFDIDPVAVEKNYQDIRANGEEAMLPLVMDLTNPSPSIGWANSERDSLAERGPVDLVMALALIHHLAISNNVPMRNIAAFLATLSKHVLIEFVPKEDSQVQKLLATREDIFDSYHIDGFEAAFSSHFNIISKDNVSNSKRTLYLLKAR